MTDAARAKVRFRLIQFLDDTSADTLLGELEAEQTAALREELDRRIATLEDDLAMTRHDLLTVREDNARVRGAAMALVEWCEHDYGDMRMCRVCAGMAIRRDEAVPHAECPVARLGALLADPEGQRAGKVEILRERLEFFAGLLTEKDGELAALREDNARLRGALERKEGLLKKACKHVPQSLYVEIVDEAALLADPEGQHVPKFGIDVWSMTNGSPEEWVVYGPHGVISHHNRKDEAESALAVERARQP